MNVPPPYGGGTGHAWRVALLLVTLTLLTGCGSGARTGAAPPSGASQASPPVPPGTGGSAPHTPRPEQRDPSRSKPTKPSARSGSKRSRMPLRQSYESSTSPQTLNPNKRNSTTSKRPPPQSAGPNHQPAPTSEPTPAPPANQRLGPN